MSKVWPTVTQVACLSGRQLAILHIDTIWRDKVKVSLKDFQDKWLFSEFCDWTSKDFFGGVKYHQWIKSLLLLAVFWPFNRYYFHPKNLASFLVILVQGYSKGSQKSLYRGLPHHFGIVQNGSFRSENFRKSANDP